MNNFISYLKKTMYLPIMAAIFFILAFIFDSPKDIFDGYIKILIDPSILITDFIAVGGLGATFFNVGTVMVFNIVMIRKLELRISGLLYSGIMCITGFSFFGKTVFNTIPIYLGIYLYSKFKKIPYKNFIISTLFATGISPLVSYCIFGFGYNIYLGIFLGVVCGVLAGLMVPALASHTIKFHQGYNLLNTGFALGIVSLFFYALFLAFGLEINTVTLIDNTHSDFLLALLFVISIANILIPLITQRKKLLVSYKLLMRKSGRLVSDFIRDFGRETVLFNVGLLGLLCCLICLTLGIEINGPIFGTILTVMGFGSAGLHIKNVVPVFVGSILTVYLVDGGFDSVSHVIAMFFVFGIAPIAGQYGFILGVISGVVHIIVAPLVLPFQGGFDLYNNGFAAGFVACIMIVMIEAFKKERK